MRVLSIHNHYRQSGGEDAVFDDEARLLEDHGHRVIRFTAHNDDLDGVGPVTLARRSVWNGRTHQLLRDVIIREQPDIVHVHNTLPIISPSCFSAAHDLGVPVVHTLHNYRLLCPGVLLLRNGRVCNDCLGRRVPWPSIRHRCYRHSRAASATVASVVSVHRAVGPWTDRIDRYIAPTSFARRKFVEGGLPEGLISVKPHFVRGECSPGRGEAGAAVFVGRLSEEKGIRTLLSAWEQQPHQAELRIVGDGPLAPLVRSAAGRHPGVRWLGARSRTDIGRLVGSASFLVFPSESYETFGRVIVEAFSVGTPVLSSDLGAGRELVDDGRTGRLFRAGDPVDLARLISWFLECPERVRPMRDSARAEFDAKYTAERNYELLTSIYRATIEQARV